MSEQAKAEDFNKQYPVGQKVRYWKGLRHGDGEVSRTRTEARVLSGHTAVVWVEGYPACIALNHIEAIEEG